MNKSQRMPDQFFVCLQLSRQNTESRQAAARRRRRNGHSLQLSRRASTRNRAAFDDRSRGSDPHFNSAASRTRNRSNQLPDQTFSFVSATDRQGQARSRTGPCRIKSTPGYRIHAIPYRGWRLGPFQGDVARRKRLTERREQVRRPESGRQNKHDLVARYGPSAGQGMTHEDASAESRDRQLFE